MKLAASGLDFFRLMLSEIPQLRTPLFYFLTKYIRHSPDLLAANYSLREPALQKQRPAPLSTILLCFRHVPAHGKLPSLSVRTSDTQDDDLYSERRESGRRGNNWSNLGMTAFCDIVQVGLCQKVPYSRQNNMLEESVSHISATQGCIVCISLCGSQTDSSLSECPTLFGLLHLRSLVLGRVCWFRMKKRRQNKINQNSFYVRITQSSIIHVPAHKSLL